MIRLDVASLPEGHSHKDLEEEASELDIDLEGGRLASPITVSLDITRNGDNLFLTGRATVNAVLECARCLEEYSYTLEGPIGLVVVVGEDKEGGGSGEGDQEDESLVRVPGGSRYIDLADEIRSELLVRIPIKPLCTEECKGLCSTCGTNLNCDKCSCQNSRRESRWDALKNLKNHS